MLKTYTTLFLLALIVFSIESFANDKLYSWTLTIKGKNSSVDYTGTIRNTLTTSSRTPEHSDPGVGVCDCCPSVYRLTEIHSVMDLQLDNPDHPPPRVSALRLFSQAQVRGLFTTTTSHTLKVMTSDCSSCCGNFYKSSCCGYYPGNQEQKSCEDCSDQWLGCCLCPCFVLRDIAQDFRRFQGQEAQRRLSNLGASTSHNLTGPVQVTQMSVTSTSAASETQTLSMPTETYAIHLERDDEQTQDWFRQIIGGSINTDCRITFPGFLDSHVRVILQRTPPQENSSNFIITLQVIQSEHIDRISMRVSQSFSTGGRRQARRVYYRIEQLTFESSDMEFTLYRTTGYEHVYTAQPVPGASLWEPTELQLPDASQIYNQRMAPPPYTPYPDGNSGFPPGK